MKVEEVCFVLVCKLLHYKDRIFYLFPDLWATSILGQFFLDGQFYLSEIDEFATLNLYFI